MLLLLKSIVRKPIAILLLFCYAHKLQAQQPHNYRFSHLDFNQGLSNNQINCIYKDAKGFMWFGTMSGLNRYDGYVFKTFRHSVKDTTTINDDYIIKIVGGPRNRLWVQTRNGFTIYDPATEKFVRHIERDLLTWRLPLFGLSDIVKTAKEYWFVYPDSGIYYLHNSKPAAAIKITLQLPAPIADVKSDANNNIWIIYQNGIIEKIDATTKKLLWRTDIVQQKQGSSNIYLYKHYIDAQGDVWVYAEGVFKGVYRIDTKHNILQQIAKDEGTAILSSNIIVDMAQDNRGYVWITTDHGGLNILDKRTMQVQVLVNDPGDDNSIAQNSVTALYKDDFGIMWMGTFKQGINYYHEGMVKFPVYRYREQDMNRAGANLPFNDVNRFAEDAKGNIWIGTNGGGLIYWDRSKNTFKQFRHNPANDNSISNDVIVSLYIDHANILWIGTYYGGLDSYDGARFTHHRHAANDSNSIADDRVWEIYEDKENNLWIGTLEAGLERYDRSTNRFYHYKPLAPNSVYAGYISSITSDNNGNLWVGTSYGIDVKNKNAEGFRLMAANITNLSNDNIISLLNDSRGNMWIGTRDGLNIYNPTANSFQVFRKEDGLPDNTILNIVEDKAQHLWISTTNGISRIHYTGSPKEGIRMQCINYDRLDGLQGKEFNENAALVTRKGEIIFGGANGFNIFDPARLQGNTLVPPVVLTGFRVFNQPVGAGDRIRHQVILQKAISETNEITLRYDENIFSIEFASLSYINTQKNKYAYKLKGFNNNWLYTDGNSRKVTYTNLDPGKYTFYVKASNGDGVWNNTGIAVNIIVLPPFWQTKLAYVLYVLAVVCMLLLVWRIMVRRAKMRFMLEHERKEANRINELNRMKIRFFTNVSHEFRTPLSLILTPLERMIKSSADPSQRSQYQLMQRNARRLLNLVNQLLDFRKMEVHELKLHATEGNIMQFIKETSYSFTDIAEKKQIAFSYTAAENRLYTVFDHDKLERILFNLLSNAFKFTAEKGMVSVEVLTTKNESNLSLEIKVKDTGIGIPHHRQHKIFERFFQHDVPGTLVNQGSGIGLAITKEFVNLFNGTIQVESEENKGSCFTVVFPVKEMPPPAENIAGEAVEPVAANEIEATPEHDTAIAATTASLVKKHTILLVEDNEDFLFYLKDNLREYYHIAEAADGLTGWQKTLAAHPDIVVCDIHMPGMNGIDLCKKIKNDPRTKHIPVVLLTAVTGEELQLRGIETGAADYITKPFNFEILLSRIKNLLAEQASLRQIFTKQVAVTIADIQVESADEKFIKDALAIVEANISNAGFSVEDLSRGLLLSRAAVYKRIFVLTGKTPTEFIRSVRLQRAAQLLEKTKITVAEAAYETGFNNPKYFSKYFKSQFGVLPSAYQAESKRAMGNKQ